MKHTFKIKKIDFKTLFLEQTNFTKLTIEKKDDFKNALNILLAMNNLDETLEIVDCYINHITFKITFQLQLKDGKTVLDFIDSIQKFESIMNISEKQSA